MAVPPRVDFRAFTRRFNGLAQEIITQAFITEAYDPADPPDPPPVSVETEALWDTGATASVIKPQVAKAVGLVSIGLVDVHHVGGRDRSPSYLINLGLPNGVAFAGVQVTECSELAGNFGAIIGMDIITQADFSLTNVNGVTTMTFRIPSIVEHDFVAEARQITSGEVGRNDLCPCHSGRKFKFCHGQRV